MCNSGSIPGDSGTIPGPFRGHSLTRTVREKTRNCAGICKDRPGIGMDLNACLVCQSPTGHVMSGEAPDLDLITIIIILSLWLECGAMLTWAPNFWFIVIHSACVMLPTRGRVCHAGTILC